MIPFETLLPIIIKKAEDHNIDHELALAFCFVESSFNPNKNRYEPAFRYVEETESWAVKRNISQATEIANQCMSWGLMQIMGATARHYGFSGDMPELCSDPATGLEFALRYLGHLLATYKNQDDAIASYNAGHPKMFAGHYANEKYVDDIHKALEGKIWNQTKTGR